MEDKALDKLKYRENSQGLFVRRPISAKSGVKFNPGFSTSTSTILLRQACTASREGSVYQG